MKRVYKILFAIVCVFASIGLIMAASDGPSADGASDAGSGGKTADSSTDASLGSNGKKYVMGIRVLFYTSTGQKIHSQDYVLHDRLSANLQTQYSNGLPCGKMDGCPSGNWSSPGNIKSTTEFSNIIGYNIDSAIRDADLSKTRLFEQLISAKDINRAKLIFNTLISPTGKNVDDFYNGDVYDLFLVWEPLGIITDNKTGKKYLGTVYELINKIQNMDSNGYKYRTSDGDTYSVWGGLGNMLTRSTGCSAYLQFEPSFVSVVGSKFNTFSGSSYFGGKLQNVNNFSNCDDNKKEILKDYGLNTSSNYAVGVLWFNDSFDGDIPGGITCQNVYDYKPYGGKENICSTIKVTGNFDFSAFNKENEGKTFPVGAENGITANWYSQNCCNSGVGEGINCTPTYNVPSCTSGTNQTLTYADTTDWQHCIFTDSNSIDGVTVQNKYDINPHKWADSKQELTYYDDNLSSDYCEVYCREEISGNFDSKNPEVLAGNHFTWGWSTVTTTRTCKTKNINTGSTDIKGSFLYDLNEANKLVVAELAKNALSNANAGGTWSLTKSGEGGTGTCEQYGLDMPGVPPKTNTCPNKELTHLYCESAEPAGYHKCYYSYQKDDTCNTYKYSKSTTSQSVEIGTIKQTATVGSSVFEKCAFSTPEGNPVSGGNVAYAITKLETVINAYKKCYNFDNTNVLNDLSVATITYKSPNGTYDYSGNMEITRDPFYDDGACGTTTEYEAFTACSGTTCSTTSIDLSNCTSHTEKGESVTQFSLEDDIYRFVIKNPNGLTLKSINRTSFEANYKNAKKYNYESKQVYEFNWTDIGYSNFPVPFNVGANYSGSLQINYSNIGHSDSADDDTAVDTILESAPPYGSYGNWSCGYTVTSKLICDESECPNDINVIYREIDLYTPFPDTNSNGRRTGDNWCGIDNCEPDADNETVKKYILQNRSVTGDDIYGLEPMYTFIMTPSDIIKIRRYNDKNTYSSYDGSLDGKNYTFTCTKGSLRNCRSDYLSQLIKDLDAENLTGSCKNDRQVYQTADANAKFESCRY